MKADCAKTNGPYLKAVCEACPHREPYVPSEWFFHIWFLSRLSQAGYPFGTDDLSIDEWLGIAEMKSELEALREMVRIGK